MARILIIEDDYKLLRSTTRILQNAGYDVCPAAAYYAALDMFRLYGNFSLCISDVEIGTYDPMLLMRDLSSIRERYHTPMLVMSENLERYQAVCDVLHLPSLAKPCPKDLLVSRVHELVAVDMNQSLVS